LPVYECRCLKCGKEFDGFATIEARDTIKCECGGAVQRLIGGVKNGLQPLTPYWSENMGKEPVFVESRSHRKQLMKERRLEIMPYKKIEINNHPKDRSGHLMTQHEIDKSRRAGLILPSR
jgi:putative FmdB family regulatory protein